MMFAVALFDAKALSHVPLVNGMVAELRKTFPQQPTLAIERAVADGLIQTLEDEGTDTHEVRCVRDYSRLCPEGSLSFSA